MGEDEYEGTSTADDVSAAADNELVKLVNKIIIDAYKQGASDIHIEPRPGKEKDPHPFSQGRLAGALHRGPGQLSQPAGDAPQDHVRPRHLRRRKPQDGKIKFRSTRRSTSSCGSPPCPPPAGWKTW